MYHAPCEDEARDWKEEEESRALQAAPSPWAPQKGTLHSRPSSNIDVLPSPRCSWSYVCREGTGALAKMCRQVLRLRG